MKDTPPEVEARYRAVLMQWTGAERLIMGCAMRDTEEFQVAWVSGEAG